MSQNLTELNVNPCKMCQPLGTATALFGIARCMTILHGSQGCATYIRRHMATHYNEPIDIASSSFTEEGAVFGGERNLKQGLANMCRLYSPSVVGVATTCLAETIGEPVERFIEEFHRDNPAFDGVAIVPVASAGYGGTHYEGYFRALRALVEHVDADETPTGRVNVVVGPASPADVRALKALLAEMGVSYTLLPDISDNLDAPRDTEYRRLKEGGTTLDEIARMAGARATLELGRFATGALSVGEYPRDVHNVPLVRLNLPCGLRDTDALVGALEKLGGTATDAMRAERGRLMDAMVDAHKLSALGRAAVYGSPDQVYGMVRLLAENGCMPSVVATGARCPELVGLAREEAGAVADYLHAPAPAVIDGADFDAIEDAAREAGANVLVGSSDGRRVARKLQIPLVRCAFPCHDHIGGQRVRTLLYDGAARMLDEVCNALVDARDATFRRDMFERYCDDGAAGRTAVYGASDPGRTDEGVVKVAGDAPNGTASLRGTLATPGPDEACKDDLAAEVGGEMALVKATREHPCFSGCAGDHARIHLPVAPACNIQCNYCRRDFDCPNESRPGVTSEVLTPEGACERFIAAQRSVDKLTVVGIAGPGDALANWEQTRSTLELVRAHDPAVTFCLSTNGLMLPLHVDDLKALGVTHLTVTLNTLDPATGARIYDHVTYLGTRYEGQAGAAVLLANQLAGIKRACELGMVVKVNTVVLKGVNADEIDAVVAKARELGCYITNLMQVIPVKGSAFEHLGMVPNVQIAEMRRRNAATMRQMGHCRQCRADAVGTLDEDRSIEFRTCSETAGGGAGGSAGREADAGANGAGRRVAVASKGGVLVDQHFGQATDFYVYEQRGEEPIFVGRRSVKRFCDGEGDGCSGAMDGSAGGRDKEGRLDEIVMCVGDCTDVVCMRIGASPRAMLATRGIAVLTTYDRIEDAVRAALACAPTPAARTLPE